MGGNMNIRGSFWIGTILCAVMMFQILDPLYFNPVDKITPMIRYSGLGFLTIIGLFWIGLLSMYIKSFRNREN
jgi:putative copper export protein